MGRTSSGLALEGTGFGSLRAAADEPGAFIHGRTGGAAGAGPVGVALDGRRAAGSFDDEPVRERGRQLPNRLRRLAPGGSPASRHGSAAFHWER